MGILPVLSQKLLRFSFNIREPSEFKNRSCGIWSRGLGYSVASGRGRRGDSSSHLALGLKRGVSSLDFVVASVVCPPP